MESVYGLYELDADAQRDGVWMPVSPLLEARVGHMDASNDRFFAVYRRRLKKIGMEAGEIDAGDPRAESVVTETVAEAVLTGWRSRESVESPWVETWPDRDGAALAPTFENKVRVLRDLPALRDQIAKFASKRQQYLRKELDAAAGN